MMLTRDQLVKPKTKEIAIEGGSVVIRALTAAEAFDLRGKDIHSVEIFGIIAMSVVDPVLTVEDVGSLATTTVTKLVSEIFAFNALGSKAIAEAESELKKTQAEG
jgi:hypothetical protein